jgi:hypothetical protein
VDDGELVRILRREVGCEHTLLCAPPPQQLARCAGRAAAPAPAAAAAPAPGHGNLALTGIQSDRAMKRCKGRRGGGETAGCRDSSFIEPEEQSS